MILTFLLGFLCCCGERGIRTPGTSRYDGFQDRCNRPLYHLSNVEKTSCVGQFYMSLSILYYIRETCFHEVSAKVRELF